MARSSIAALLPHCGPLAVCPVAWPSSPWTVTRPTSKIQQNKTSSPLSRAQSTRLFSPLTDSAEFLLALLQRTASHQPFPHQPSPHQTPHKLLTLRSFFSLASFIHFLLPSSPQEQSQGTHSSGKPLCQSKQELPPTSLLCLL